MIYFYHALGAALMSVALSSAFAGNYPFAAAALFNAMLVAWELRGV